MKAAFVVLALLLAGGLAADARPQDGASERLAAACRDLEGNDPRRIFASVQAIAQLGGAALPAIEARARDARGRVRDYLELAAEEIRSAPHLPGYPAVKRVSMKSSDRNVVELLADLRAKTGTALSLENLMDEDKLPELPFEVKDATMLEAFDAICHAGNVAVSMQNGQFALYAGTYAEVPRFFYGHYFLRLGDFELQKTVTFRKPATQTFSLDMEMIWDPAAAPLRFRPVRVVEALDDRGKNLVLPPVEDEEPGPSGKIFLAPPSLAATKITLLRGFATIVLPQARLTASFPEPKETQDATAGEFQVRILSVDLDQHTLRLKLASKKTAPEALSRMDFLAQVALKDWESTAASVDKISSDADGLDLAVAYLPLRHKDGLARPTDGVPQPKILSLDLSIVTAEREKRIPFEFRDLKLR